VSLPPSSYELIARCHSVSAAFGARMRSAVGALPGNPGRVSVRQFGDVWAVRCELPDPPGWTNMLDPMRADDLDVLPEALAWYGDKRPWINVTPHEGHTELARALVGHGWAPTHFIDILRGPTAQDAHVPSPPGVEISVVSRDDALLFTHTLLEGHHGTYDEHEAVGLASLVGVDGITCYLARVDGEPAAAAVLSIDDGVAYLANASALPQFRNRGCHSALLATRIHDAADAGFDSVMALAAVASTSHRNMERAGLHPLATMTQWTFGAPA
jgi:ribosomal protein S18 acetylase RimI-like enzyme